MTVSEYLDVLADLGVDTDALSVNNGHILRMRNGRRAAGVYFNRNRDGVIHFTLNPNSLAVIDLTLWECLPDEVIKKVDHGKPNVVPKPDRERQALRQLLESAGVLYLVFKEGLWD